MAAASTSSRVVAGWAVLAALLSLLAVTGASTLTVFDGPGCTGNVAVQSCGSCGDISQGQNGGYYFLYTSGSAYLYSSADCAGTPAAVLTDDVWSCSDFSYQSAYISCSSSLSSWDITTKAQH